jgi:hypothetical protein
MKFERVGTGIEHARGCRVAATTFDLLPVPLAGIHTSYHRACSIVGSPARSALEILVKPACCNMIESGDVIVVASSVSLVSTGGLGIDVVGTVAAGTAFSAASFELDNSGDDFFSFSFILTVSYSPWECATGCSTLLAPNISLSQDGAVATCSLGAARWCETFHAVGSIKLLLLLLLWDVCCLSIRAGSGGLTKNI